MLPRSGPLAALLVAAPLVAVAGASAWLAAPEPAPPETQRELPPARARPDAVTYAALGDSITRATASEGLGDRPARSWATGDFEGSIASRLRDRTGEPFVALNLAEAGARAEDLPRQAALASASGVDVATVLIGANDACAAGPLDPEAFRASVRAGLAALPRDARVVVLAVPDVGRLSGVLGPDAGARGTWLAFGTCSGILVAPGAGTARVGVLNGILEEEASRAGAAFSKAPLAAGFGPEDVSTWDFFHPSVAGQRRLAAAAWPDVASAVE